MPGSPKKREQREIEAIKRLELTAKAKSEQHAARPVGRPSTYTDEKAARVVQLIAAGLPILDSTLRGRVISQGVASVMHMHPSTLYDWQIKHPEFAEAIARAREEAAHALADRMLALADVALQEPIMANAVRVCADIFKWQAEVRAPAVYAERRRLEIAAAPDLGARLRRAAARERAEREGRVVEADTAALPAPHDDGGQTS